MSRTILYRKSHSLLGLGRVGPDPSLLSAMYEQGQGGSSPLSAKLTAPVITEREQAGIFHLYHFDQWNVMKASSTKAEEAPWILPSFLELLSTMQEEQRQSCAVSAA